MKKIKEILGGLWKLYALIWFLSLLLLLYPFYLIFLLNEKHFNKGFQLLRFHTGILLYLVGIFITIENKHYIKKNQTYVITPNHTSYLDIIILYQIFSRYFVFMGKKELGDVPVFNIFFKKMNITVDRKSGQSGKRAIDRCANELDKGNSVVLFPEGTISKDVPTMLRFKSGAFKLAIEKQQPILPITFLTNHKRLEMKGLFTGKAGPGIAKVIINEPISTVGMTEEDLLPLQEKVFNIINEQVQNYVNR
jgi:1-acyl-sn-glycerol-3-phosphate acyltransferase